MSMIEILCLSVKKMCKYCLLFPAREETLCLRVQTLPSCTHGLIDYLIIVLPNRFICRASMKRASEFPKQSTFDPQASVRHFALGGLWFLAPDMQ